MKTQIRADDAPGDDNVVWLAFKQKHQLRIDEFLKKHPNRPLPVLFDKAANDFHWMNRIERRARGWR